MDLIEQIKELENLIDNNEDNFLLHCFKLKRGDTLMGITGIYFGSERIRFNYITNNGISLMDSISWEQFNEWKAKL